MRVNLLWKYVKLILFSKITYLVYELNRLLLIKGIYQNKFIQMETNNNNKVHIDTPMCGNNSFGY